MRGSLPLTGERTLPGIPAENYWYRRHVAAYRFAARMAGGLVLDAGCGEGYGSAILSRHAHRVIALERDETTVVHAATKYRSPEFLRGDLVDLPLAGSSVDAIVALQVIEHLEDPDSFVSECSRVLRTGGLLVLSTPNRATFPAELNPFHVHEYDGAELAGLLRRRFTDVRLLGLVQVTALLWLERALGEPIQERLIRTPYEELPLGVRAVLRTVTAHAFRATPDHEHALDLLAVCRNAPYGAQP